jgi:hypothetical protein
MNPHAAYAVLDGAHRSLCPEARKTRSVRATPSGSAPAEPGRSSSCEKKVANETCSQAYLSLEQPLYLARRIVKAYVLIPED